MIAECSVTLENKTKSELILFIEELQNMLEGKDKEIEKLKKHNKELLRKLRNRVKEVKKLNKYSLYKKEFKTLNKQLKKKDEIIEKLEKEAQKYFEEIIKQDREIDLMADSFAEDGFYNEHCQTLIDNELCPGDCNKCVKQYFGRKATNDG